VEVVDSPWLLASPVIVGAGMGIDCGSGRFFRGVLCPLGSRWLYPDGKGATAREYIVVGVIGSSVKFCIECLFVTATVEPEK
jgi:hypothetical protein